MASAEEPVFDAVLRPHRSLSPLGVRLLLAAFAGAFLLIGTGFALIGAWPVLPLCGLEVVLLWGAFRLNFRAARRYEAVRLTQSALEIARVAPSGAGQRIDFRPPHWLAVDLRERPDGSNSLVLRSHGRSVRVGEFLSTGERASFAFALRRALDRLRGLAS